MPRTSCGRRLSVIEANTSLALTQDRDAVWYRAAFQRVDRESKRMRRLLEDMLWLARFDATQRPSDNEPVDLGMLAAQAADRFGAVAETRRLDLRVRRRRPARRGRRAARSARPAAGRPPRQRLQVRAGGRHRRGHRARDGPARRADGRRLGARGSPRSEREQIFDRFHRATDAGARAPAWGSRSRTRSSGRPAGAGPSARRPRVAPGSRWAGPGHRSPEDRA